MREKGKLTAGKIRTAYTATLDRDHLLGLDGAGGIGSIETRDEFRWAAVAILDEWLAKIQAAGRQIRERAGEEARLAKIKALEAQISELRDEGGGGESD